jgi:hypothetical protein
MTAAPATTNPAEPRFEETQRAFLVLRLVTEVRADGLHVRLAPIPGTRQHVPFADVESVEVASYDAGEHGGWHWGVRFGPGGDAVYRLSGSRGVRVRLADGGALFVGSQRPAELRDAIAART